jgi:hypothetical protein
MSAEFAASGVRWALLGAAFSIIDRTAKLKVITHRLLHPNKSLIPYHSALQ